MTCTHVFTVHMYNVVFRKNHMYPGSFVHCTSYDIDDSNDFEYLVIVHFDHIRFRLGVYIAFVYLFAYHMG